MIPPIPSVRFKSPQFEAGQRIRSHSLIHLAGGMDRGAIRKGTCRNIEDSSKFIWKARCVQWSGGTSIWEICDKNDYPKSI